MHRWSFREYALCEEEARIYRPDGRIELDLKVLVPALLSSCIESWSLEQPVTRQAIESLPRHVVDTLYARLRRKSEPSSDRLAFLRAGGGRPEARKAARRA
jgi:hypothetical protein